MKGLKSIQTVSLTAYKRTRELAEQFYSPREIASVLGLCLFGLVVVTYRWITEPSTSPINRNQYLLEARHNDSVFRALSLRQQIEEEEDTLPHYLTTGSESSSTPAQVEKSRHAKALPAPHSISLNRAKETDLQALPGVGPATAKLITDYRKERGKFRTVEELTNIRGIGEKKLERMRDYLTLD